MLPGIMVVFSNCKRQHGPCYCASIVENTKVKLRILVADPKFL